MRRTEKRSSCHAKEDESDRWLEYSKWVLPALQDQQRAAAIECRELANGQVRRDRNIYVRYDTKSDNPSLFSVLIYAIYFALDGLAEGQTDRDRSIASSWCSNFTRVGHDSSIYVLPFSFFFADFLSRRASMRLLCIHEVIQCFVLEGTHK